MPRRHAFAAALALALPLAASAASAPKPSQLASARAVSTPCPTKTSPSNTAYEITSMSTPDGDQTQFVVPPKQVFVITSAHLTMSGGPADSTVQIYLSAVDADSGSVLVEGLTTTNANGVATVDRTLPTGIAVRSGLALCVLGSDGGTLGSVTGYFAKDK